MKNSAAQKLFTFSLLLATFAPTLVATGEDVVDRTAKHIAAVRDFEIDGVTFESSYGDVKAAFPHAKNAPISMRPDDNVMLAFALDNDVMGYVHFTRKVKYIREFKFVYGGLALKKAGGVDVVYAAIQKKFGEPSSAKIHKMDDEKLSSYVWRYDSEIKREIHLNVRDTANEEVMILSVSNRSLSDSPTP